MKLSLILAVLLAASSLTACMEPKPGQYPPSAMMERESMPDKADEKKSKG
ncbi:MULTISPECIES: hypothetical protein [unclassified Nitrosomonas]|nr:MULTISPECIES: hypothetical protein [unclassified Nitrosomonas]MDV6345316.1 hypothetical protein [Nitrosomonas sp. Is37]SDY36794.1 hypothetical protein SAMN05421755_101827 [Nitrosomonas sp. Nm33]